MASLIIAYNTVIEPIEGFYSNDVTDSGGETIFGIARKKNPAWPGWIIVDSYRKQPNFPDNMRGDTRLNNLKLQLYKSNYWDINNLDAVNSQPIANELLDISVNMGPGVAAEFVQRSLNLLNRNGQDYKDLLLDHRIGPATLATLNKHPEPQTVLKLINVLQGAKYITICEANPSQEKYMNGWLKRVNF